MKPAITFNCPEKWENMKIGMVSRFCCNCNKDVHDFTLMTREEILFFLLSNQNKKVCGRIKRSQLNYHHDEILLIVESYLNKNKNSNLAFYLLTIGSLFLLSCSQNNKEKSVTSVNDSIVLLIQGKEGVDSVKAVGVKEKAVNTHIAARVIEEEVLLGDIQMVPDTISIPDFDGVRCIAEVMPEFNGGVEGLKSFIKDSLEYPKWEKENRIEGTVFVSFIIDEEGKAKEPEILKSVESSRNFDSEVIRVIEMMPNWNPAQENGKPVAIRFVIPVKFVL